MRLLTSGVAIAVLLSVLSPLPPLGTGHWHGPYVQKVGSDRATIVWITSDAAPGLVEARPAGGGAPFEAVSEVRELSTTLTGLDRPLYQHRASLASLAPNEEYAYRVMSGNAFLGGDGELRFKTAGTGPFTFLALGDAGHGSLGQAQIAARMNEEDASLVLITGDVVYHGSTFAAYLGYYFPFYAHIMKRVPFFPSLGNHDYEASRGAPYFAVHVLPDEGVPAVGQGRFYSFDWGNAHFVCLDSIVSLDEAVRGDGPMLDWLDRDLTGSRKFWKVVYLHHPPFPTNNYTWDPTCAALRERVVPILERHHVDLVLAGHEHNYQRTHPRRNGEFVEGGQGSTYIVTGGGGAPLYETRDDRILAARKSAYHYVRFEVAGVRMKLTAIDADGERIDTAVLAPPPEISPGGVVDSFSYKPSLKTGGYVSIFGHHLALGEPEPGDVTITLNGIELPVLYASPGQINARLPAAAMRDATLRIRSRNGAVETLASIRDLP